MELEPIIAVAATLAGACLGAAPLLQALRVLRTRSAVDVSLGALGVLICGSSVWLLWAVVNDSVPVLVTNTVGVSCSTACLAVSLRYRRPEPTSRPAA